MAEGDQRVLIYIPSGIVFPNNFYSNYKMFENCPCLSLCQSVPVGARKFCIIFCGQLLLRSLELKERSQLCQIAALLQLSSN